MSFRDFVEKNGSNMGESRTSLAFHAMKYARHLGLPNICSISSNVFTHGDLFFDPADSFNSRFFNDPKSIVQIAPAVAERTGYVHNSGWFDREKEDGLLSMLGVCVHAWLIFSVNPRIYGLTGHQVGLTNLGCGYYDVWDTAQNYPNQTLNERQVWDLSLSHMYGDRPVAITFS